MKWLNRSLLVPCMLWGCKHFLSSGWCGFWIWFGWSAKGRRHSLSIREYLFHMSPAKRKPTSFGPASGPTLHLPTAMNWQYSRIAFLYMFIFWKSLKLVRAFTAISWSLLPRHTMRRQSNPVIFPKVLKLRLTIFNSLKLLTFNKQLCIPLAPSATSSNLSSRPF